jgi:two-component system response regulator AdeR
VLCTLLERRGAIAIEAPRPEEALQLTRLHRPDLIVLDAENDWLPSGQPLAELQAAARDNDTPIVILGSIRRSQDDFSPDDFLTKPYHYGQLLRKIEELLAVA